VTDPREYRGLHPDGIWETCPSCKAMVAVRTRVTDGTRHESCARCGHSFEACLAGTFDTAGSFDL
jgi:hypothetical protein